MGAQDFRDLQTELLGRSATVATARDGVDALLGALHWEGPKGDDFRAKQVGSMGELDDLVAEIDLAATYAGQVADEIDDMMATYHQLIDTFGAGVEIVWDGAGRAASVVSDGVSFLADGAGDFVNSAGDALGDVLGSAGDVAGGLVDGVTGLVS